MSNPVIINYINENLQNGHTPEVIKTALTQAGWKTEDIEEAFRSLSNTPPQAPLATSVNEVYPKINIDRIQDPSRLLNFPILGLFIKYIFLIPVVFVFYFVALWTVFIVLAINPWIVLIRGKYWQYAFNLGIGLLRMGTKVSFYFYGLTNKYPGFSTQINDTFTVEMDYPEHSGRLLNSPLLGLFIKEIILIPVVIFQVAIMCGAILGMFVSQLVVLVTKTYPESCFELIRDSSRGLLSISAYIMGLTDRYPSFKISRNHAAKKIILIVLALLLYIATISASASLKGLEPSPLTTPETDTLPVVQDNIVSDLSTPDNIARYSVDTDGDLIPDFLEIKMGEFVKQGGVPYLGNTLMLGGGKRAFNPEVAVVDECVGASCGEADISEVQKTKTNILLIFDASGSMAQSAGGTTKLQAAKDAVDKFIDGLNTPDLNIALMVYGHKGSNAASDKAYSCSQIDILYPLGPLDKTVFKNAIAGFTATGWTPIEGAFNLAPSVFAGKEDQNNRIILISDGMEQCGGNPVVGAKKLKDSAFKLTVDIIGFQAGSSDQQQLKAIAESTGGNFVNTTNSNEVYKEMLNQSKSFWKNVCLVLATGNYTKCLFFTYLGTSNYLNLYASNELYPTYYKTKNETLKAELKAEIDLTNKLRSTLYEIGTKLYKEKWDETNTNAQEQWDKARQILENK